MLAIIRIALAPLRTVAAMTALSLVVPASAATHDAQLSGEVLSVPPGGVVRWPSPGTTLCRMAGLVFEAVESTCYYPIDVLHKPGMISLTRQNADGQKETARVRIEPRNYGKEEIELPDIPQAHPSLEDQKRNQREQAVLGKIFLAKERPRQFSLPIGKPASPLPKGNAFGVDRVFNGKPAPQPHMGSDYPVSVGSPVVAAADGTVVLAEDLFYPGQAVIIDHGHGLMSMYFHLSEIKAQAGQSIKKGTPIGLVGSTGRATGPHLFFALRWHNSRIDPQWLLNDPTRMPTVAKRPDDKVARR